MSLDTRHRVDRADQDEKTAGDAERLARQSPQADSQRGTIRDLRLARLGDTYFMPDDVLVGRRLVRCAARSTA